MRCSMPTRPTPAAAHINTSYRRCDEYVSSIQSPPKKSAPVYTIAPPNSSRFYQSRYTKSSHLLIYSPAETASYPPPDSVISSGPSLHSCPSYPPVSQYNNYKRTKATRHSAQNSTLFVRTSVLRGQ